jgi:hypothetical protein
VARKVNMDREFMIKIIGSLVLLNVDWLPSKVVSISSLAAFKQRLRGHLEIQGHHCLWQAPKEGTASLLLI